MSKRRNRSRSRSRSQDRGHQPELDVVTQLQTAARHPGAAALGAAIGGIVPWFARSIAHEGIPRALARDNHWLAGAELVVALGCALFSIATVYKFGLAAFGQADARRAAGFCVALEGVMLVTGGATSAVAFIALIAINAIVNGCAIALRQEATARRREADDRRRATRRETMARRRGEPTPRPVPAGAARDRAATVRVPPTPVVALARRWRDDAIDAQATYS